MIIIYKYIVILVFASSYTAMAQYDFYADVTEGCDSLIATFSFTSTATVDTINYIIWDFFNGEIDTTLDISDEITTRYSIPATYPVIVYINDFFNGEPFIRNNYITVHHTVNSEFTIKDTSQIAPYTYTFSDASSYFESTTFAYGWNFGDGNTGAGMDIIHTYDSPGTYDIILSVLDGYGCISTATKSIDIPALILPPDFIASDTVGCDSLKVKFSLVDVDTDTVSSILWDFGNGETSTMTDPDTVIYRAGERPVQNYSVSVIINGDTDNAVEKTDLITIHRSVRASLECIDSLRTENSIIKVCYNLDHLFDTSAVYGFEWRMQGFTPTNDIRPLYTFENEPDTIQAELTITDSTYGCSDTRIKRIFIIPEVLIQIQNVFTPNGDGINEYFVISASGEIHDIHLQIRIFSRSGLLVYEAEGTEIVWDGKSPSGIELESGIYYYVLSSLSSDDPEGKYNTTGFVYLLK